MKIRNAFTVALTGLALLASTLVVDAAPAAASNPYSIIYLTFDDGPDVYSDEVMDLLDKYGAKATFFVTGEHVERNPKEYLRMVKSGHAVANHTWSHRNLTTLSKTLVQRELTATQRVMYPYQSQCFRPPFLATNERVRQWGRDLGLKQIMVTLSAGRADETNWRRIYHRVTNDARNGDIGLMHAEGRNSSASVEALKHILPDLKRRGFRMRALPQCQ